MNSYNKSFASDNIALGNNRFVNCVEYKGKFYVTIREYYENNCELYPGKKG